MYSRTRIRSLVSVVCTLSDDSIVVTTADLNTIATTPSKIAEIEDGGSALAKNRKRAGLARLQPRKNGRFARAQEVEAQVDRETWLESVGGGVGHTGKRGYCHNRRRT